MNKAIAAQLVETHRDELLRFITRRVSCQETAFDILQNCFFRLAAYMEEKTVQNPRAFLFRVAANLATDHLRSQESRRESAFDEDAFGEFADESPSLEDVVFSQQQLAMLKQALLELPRECREVFILCKFEHYTYPQVAKMLGVSETSVTRHMIKALEHCKQRLFGNSRKFN